MPSFRVHVAFGIGVGAVVAAVSQDPIAIPVAAIASLSPDVDVEGSYASRRVLVPIWLFSRHRGAWHSLAAAMAAGFAAALGGVLLWGVMAGTALGVAAFGGWFSHIAADRLTTRGRTYLRGRRRREPDVEARAVREPFGRRRRW